MGYFRRKKDGFLISLDSVEVALLEQVIGEMSEVIGEPPEHREGAEWARGLGLAALGQEEAPREPDNPIRARLYPAAYQGEDDVDGAASDFRRFTEDELRAGKAANALAMLHSLPEEGGTVKLDAKGAASWLGGLNDARLALGTALDVDETSTRELATLDSDEPRAQRLLVYQWLGELQSSLLDALTAH